MVGQGPLRDSIGSRIASLGMRERIRLLGWWDHARRLMVAADIVTLTSRWEGAPYSLLEAMAASRPVVATAVNGCPEIVADRESGYLVPWGDTSAWAAKVLDLLDHPRHAARMGKAGRTRVESLFSIQETTAHTLALYARLAQQGSPQKGQ
jgi:glycosyltransferase involved in cell wall biosynthesis